MVEVHIDGAARGNPGDAGIGVIIRDKGKVVEEIGAYIGQTTNNIAEYMALIRGLEQVLLKGYKDADFFSDSELLVKQLNGEYKVKHPNLVPLYYQVLALVEKMGKFSIKYVPREKNPDADRLANIGIDVHEKKSPPLFSPKK
jgi:ribonuclease HI